MKTDILEKYIQTLLPISTEKVKLIIAKYEELKLEKSTLLLKENKICKEAYFLENGCIRSFIYNNDGQEVTTNIYTAPCYVFDFLSFFKQQPSKENFQTLTDCALWTMNYEDLQICFHTIPEFREFGRMMLVTNYSKLHERMIGMIKDTAEERYKKLLAEDANIFQQVPLKIIASYLGVTDTSLSRIRKEITRK
jgi:CRP-like cAMP-binding protein